MGPSESVLVDSGSVVAKIDRVSPIGRSLSDSDLDVSRRGENGVVVDEST